MSVDSISSKDKNLYINKLTKEYYILIAINIMFIIIGIFNFKFYETIINLSRITLLWIFLYTISYNTKSENKNFFILVTISSITFIFIESAALIQEQSVTIDTILLALTIMNLGNLLYFKHGSKNKNLAIDIIISAVITIIVACILYKVKTDINKINIIIIINCIMSFYNSFVYNNNNFEYYKMIKNLSFITFIMNIIVLLTGIYKYRVNIELLRGILLLISFNYIYYGYRYTIKNIIENPYFKLKSKNEKLNLDSEKLDKFNDMISKEIEIQLKIKEYIIQRQELLKQSLDIMPSIWMITDYNFNIVYKNNKFIEDLGDNIYNFLEIVELINNKDIMEYLEYLRCLEHKKALLDTVVFLNEKAYILNIKQNDIDNNYLISLNDITNELKMEKKLEDKKEEYEGIVKNIPCPIMIRNIDKNIGTINVKSINKEFERLFGYSSCEIEGISLIDFYEKFNLEFFDTKKYKKLEMTIEEKIKDIQNAIDTNYIVNCTMTDKNKKEHNLELSINDYIEDSENLKLLTYRDKTKEIGVYQEINKQYQLYKHMLDSIPEGIIVESINSKRIYTNKKFKEIFGIRKKKIKILTQKYRNRLETKYSHNIQNGDENKTIYIVNEDKKIKEVQIYYRTWMLDNEEHRVKIIRDLEQQRKSERIKERLIKQREYDKMKMEFYTNMSHELKTPLNLIFSSIQLIETLNNCGKIKDNNGEISYHVKIVKQNMFRLMRLINNIINISQVKSEIYNLKAINFDIVYLVEEIVMSINSYAESKGLSLIFDTNEEYLLVGLDPESIERIVLNLLSNSIKFTPSEGEILVGIYKIKDRVQIKVKDSGVGINEDKLMDIFDRFKQIEDGKIDNEFGSGIGLYLSKSLVETQDGTININSKIGEGTEVIIEFPIQEVIEENEEIIEYSANIEKFKIEFFDIYK